MSGLAILEKLAFYERRKRVRRPPALILFGLFFLLVLPVYNYLGVAVKYRFSPASPEKLTRFAGNLELFLLFMPMLVGVGLLLVRNWGWWLFLGFSAALLSFNAYALIRNPGLGNISALVQSAVILAAVFYFLRPDVAAPFMKMHPRGWRFQKRRPIRIIASVNGRSCPTRDLSGRGIYVKWPQSNFELGDEVDLEFELGGERFSCRGGVASITENHGFGIAFRELAPVTRERIAELALAEQRKQEKIA